MITVITYYAQELKTKRLNTSFSGLDFHKADIILLTVCIFAYVLL